MPHIYKFWLNTTNTRPILKNMANRRLELPKPLWFRVHTLAQILFLRIEQSGP